MRYSFLMPYHRRAEQLDSTFDSFVHFYKTRIDFEIIIIEDIKNTKNQYEHDALINLVQIFCRRFPIRLLTSDVETAWNPSLSFNMGAKVAEGEFLIITNPEVMHETDVLKGLDEEFAKSKDVYVMCSCKSIKAQKLDLKDIESKQFVWYQHSQYRNARCHFCSAISKQNYEKIGGFDPAYANGMCFEDDDLRNTIDKAKMSTVLRDDLVTIHLEHGKSKPPNYAALHRTNKQYYESKWDNAVTAERISIR